MNSQDRCTSVYTYRSILVHMYRVLFNLHWLTGFSVKYSRCLSSCDLVNTVVLRVLFTKSSIFQFKMPSELSALLFSKYDSPDFPEAATVTKETTEHCCADVSVNHTERHKYSKIPSASSSPHQLPLSWLMTFLPLWELMWWVFHETRKTDVNAAAILKVKVEFSDLW